MKEYEVVNRVIPIGYSGDQNTLKVIFDVSEYPDYDVHLFFQRPGSEMPYPVEVVRDGDTVYWIPDEVDTEFPGDGRAELKFTKGDEKRWEVVYLVHIRDSLSGSTADKPDDFEPWLEVMQAKVDEAQALLDNIVIVDDEEPEFTSNRIWVKETPEETVEIPSMDDLDNLIMVEDDPDEVLLPTKSYVDRVAAECTQIKEDLNRIDTAVYGMVPFKLSADNCTTGYYKDNGAPNFSNKYIRCNEVIAPHGKTLFVHTPTGYSAKVFVYNSITADASSFSGVTYGTVDGTGSDVIVTNAYKYYRVDFGRWGNDDAAAYINDDFLSTVVVELRDTPVRDSVNAEMRSQHGCIAMFDRIGICGYSWDSGYLNAGTGFKTRREHSWGAILARKNGIEAAVYGVPSGTTKAPSSAYTEGVCWQSDSHGLPKLLSDTECQLYWLRMIGNDATKLGMPYLGSLADITAHEEAGDYPDTFYGNYGRIMSQIKAHAPDAKFIFSGSRYDGSGDTDKAYWSALEEIAAYYGVPTINWLDDIWYFNTFEVDRGQLVQNHPVAPHYAAMAMAAERLFGKCVAENFEYFGSYLPPID